jgi:hypothetical protein
MSVKTLSIGEPLELSVKGRKKYKNKQKTKISSVPT